MGKADAFILTERPELSWGPELGMEFHETFELDLPLCDGETLVVGNTKIERVHIPGHTPGATSYFFQLFDGTNDYTVGIHGGTGLNTLTDEYLAKYSLSHEARR